MNQSLNCALFADVNLLFESFFLANEIFLLLTVPTFTGDPHFQGGTLPQLCRNARPDFGNVVTNDVWRLFRWLLRIGEYLNAFLVEKYLFSRIFIKETFDGAIDPHCIIVTFSMNLQLLEFSLLSFFLSNTVFNFSDNLQP